MNGKSARSYLSGSLVKVSPSPAEPNQRSSGRRILLEGIEQALEEVGNIVARLDWIICEQRSRFHIRYR
jgi:hypothetical protein